MASSPYILSPNTDSELDRLLVENHQRLLVLVFTTAWCKNCKRLGEWKRLWLMVLRVALASALATLQHEWKEANAIEEMAEDLHKIATVIHVDVDELLLPMKPTYEESDDQLLGWISNTVKSFARHWNASYSKITDHLAFSPTPTEYQIEQGLVKVGFRSVIGMESKQNPGEYSTREREIWKAAGIDYVSYPIKAADEISLNDFDEILQLVESLQGPILIHSDIGQVAAIMVFVMVAKQNHRKGSEVAGWARELGFDFEGLGRLTQTICAWVDK
ncbi:hypothetical protein EC968_004574 [Mortierella alpina]|nr:hypothetical protein EC968_004574 [Mortierella alpina]